MTTLICGNTGAIRAPEGYKVKAQTYEKLEVLAEQIRDLFKKTGIIDENGVIDCSSLLEQVIPKYLGVDYVIRDDDQMNGCAAFVAPTEKILVVANSVYDGLSSKKNYSRSTVVHEFAHLALSHHVTLHRGAVVGRHEFYEDSEWQAKALTAAIMMPQKMCQTYVLNPCGLALHCQVSVETAKYRIQRLLKDKKISPQAMLGGLS